MWKKSKRLKGDKKKPKEIKTLTFGNKNPEISESNRYDPAESVKLINLLYRITYIIYHSTLLRLSDDLARILLT